jgi:hypothetical protein
MINTIVGAGAASRYGSGSDKKMRLLAAPAPQHCFYFIRLGKLSFSVFFFCVKMILLFFSDLCPVLVPNRVHTRASAGETGFALVYPGMSSKDRIIYQS